MALYLKQNVFLTFLWSYHVASLNKCYQCGKLEMSTDVFDRLTDVKERKNNLSSNSLNGNSENYNEENGEKVTRLLNDCPGDIQTFHYQVQRCTGQVCALAKSINDVFTAWCLNVSHHTFLWPPGFVGSICFCQGNFCNSAARPSLSCVFVLCMMSLLGVEIKRIH